MGIDLSGRHCVVVGGGTVAERRIETLLRSGAKVSVMSPALTTTLTESLDQFHYIDTAYSEDRFTIEFLQKGRGEVSSNRPYLVLAATNSTTVNERVHAQVKDVVPLINIASNQKLSSFHFPAVVERGPLHIGVTTSGLSPLLGKRICEQLSTIYGEEYALFLQRLGQLREEAYKEAGNPKEVRQLLKAVVENDDILEYYRKNDLSKAETLIKDALRIVHK
ncbi:MULTISPECIES: precorrin-2 dehydrogenase/sirohydrochlorin ferrochelatase family protein [Bacillaceae]|uniref:precorrin-2 dehydrogenase n=1 Tax=Evansella alkalicola TaxID=745819 RepID=A0ABS6JY85_9BACI|nr:MULTISPECIES: bifunctional precorrin-2 dehydrogenase/sirohydrochlorin ferrochelatase [Bacillaceae]MBU9723563.1 bifunctional precorrin-2 dehydrogenase/sirohydrochlorin ferrochelatase [Bacillus alkalicola]